MTGSVVRNPGDVIVSSLVSGGKLDKPAPVSWRVLNSRWVEYPRSSRPGGVWLAITQQQDFVSTIDNAHGDVGVLIAQLQDEVVGGHAADARR